MSQVLHGPHTHTQNHLSQMMFQVLLALTPVTLYAFWLYGWPAFYLWLVCIGSSLFWEAVFLRLFGKPVARHLLDGSALVTGWLLALCLPPWAPWWLACLGSFLAVAMIKQIFGGLGQNVFNPAMAARVMLLIAFPVEMTRWIDPSHLGEARIDWQTALQVTFAPKSSAVEALVNDGYTGATLLDGMKQHVAQGGLVSDGLIHFDYHLWSGFGGYQAGSLGETSALLILLGGLFLLWRQVITWQAPAGLLLGVALPAFLLHLAQPESYPPATLHLLSGGTFLAAFFIVTDPVTGPNTALGRFIFGLGCGLLAWVIRTFGNYPEGMAFAVMLMNAAVPVIDRYIRPRVYGRRASGEPLPIDEKSSGGQS